MTIAILSPVLRATSGRAPVFRATMRFWISVDSLKRPPTLLTMPSSFSSSSIRIPLEKGLDDLPQLGEGRNQIVVDDLEIVIVGAGQLRLGGTQPLLDLLLRFRAARSQ